MVNWSSRKFIRALVRGMTAQILPRLGAVFDILGKGIKQHQADLRLGVKITIEAFDAHLNLLEESAYLPSLALGLRDFIGTGWYSSEYIVGTKTFGDIAVTGGLGFGRLVGRHRFDNPFTFFPIGSSPPITGGGDRGGTLGNINWFQGCAPGASPIVTMMISSLQNIPLILWGAIRLPQSDLTLNLGAQYRLNETIPFPLNICTVPPSPWCQYHS